MSVCIHITSSIKLVFVHANVVGDCKDIARWLLGLECWYVGCSGSFLEVLRVVARLQCCWLLLGCPGQLLGCCWVSIRAVHCFIKIIIKS